MFLNAMQTYFNLDYKKEFTRLYRQDKYYILNKPQPIGRSDITRINQNGVLPVYASTTNSEDLSAAKDLTVTHQVTNVADLNRVLFTELDILH